MNRRDLMLAVLAAGEGRPYSPVQLQKALFLITENLKAHCDDHDRFDFRPYDYGPFDHNVYRQAEELESEGLAVSLPGWNGRWKEYAATDLGVTSGLKILERIEQPSREYILAISSWVRNQSFQSLVKSIYEA